MFNLFKNLCYGILALGTLAQHILLANGSIEIDAGYASTLLSAVVLFLHHKVELVHSPPGGVVFFCVICYWLFQANHRYATFVLQLFHYSEQALMNDIKRGWGLSTVDEYSG